MSVDPPRTPSRSAPRLEQVERERQSSAPWQNRMTVTRKLLLVLMIGLSTYLGVMPVTIVLGGARWAYLIWLIVVTQVVFAVRHLESVATEQPTSRDYLAAFFTSFYPPLALNLMWLTTYGMLRLLALFARLVARLVGLPAGWSTEPFAFYGSLCFAVPFSFVLPQILLPALMSYLYPNAAGVLPAFRRLPEGRQRLLLIASMTILFQSVFLGQFSAVIPDRTFQVSYAFLLMGAISTSAILWAAGLRSVVAKDEAAWHLSRIFEALGFRVRFNLATGNKELDPLLVELDMVAWRDLTAYAVKVKVPQAAPGRAGGGPPRLMIREWQQSFLRFLAPGRAGGGPPRLSWEVGPTVLVASSLAWDFVPPQIRAVRSMLVLVDVLPDEELVRFAEQQSILIWNVPNGVLTKRNPAFRDTHAIAKLAVASGLTALLDGADERLGTGAEEG